MGDITDVSILSTHAVTHKSGGSDSIRLDELAAPADNSTLNSSTTAHGLLKKLDNSAVHYLDGQGNFSAISASALPAHNTRHQSGGADPIKLDDLAAPDDNADLNASTAKHGLLPKLPGGTTDFLRADGAFAAPPGGGGTPPYVYDAFAATYVIVTENTLTPDLKWRLRYHGARPDSPSDIGQAGVRVPGAPTHSFPRVMYEYPYVDTYTGSGTAATMMTTETSYFTDLDFTTYMRTIDQRKSTPNPWEAAWVFFHFNEAHGTNFHHYYLILKTNGRLELGRKDNTTQTEEQTFLYTSAADNEFTFAFNTWNKVRVVCEDVGTGIHIQVWVDDVSLIDLVDDGTVGSHFDGGGSIPLLPPSIYMYSGLIGNYNEDAEVEFGPMTITPINSSINAVTTYSSDGLAGVPIILTKDGSNLPFKNIAAGSGRISVTNNTGNKTVDIDIAEMTGVIKVALDGSGDYTSLGAAVTAEGTKKKYELGPGDFSLSSQGVFTTSDIMITGSGEDVSRIVYNMGSTGAGLKFTGSIGSAFDVTPTVARHSHTVTLASTTGLAAGDWVYITRDVEIDSSTTGRYDAEIHKILTVDSGTQITLEDQVYEAFNTTDNSNLYKITWVRSLTIKDITLFDNRSSVSNITEQADTLFLFCYNLNLERVKFESMIYASCGIQNCFHSTLTAVGFESPRELSGGGGIKYGLYSLAANNNLTVNGAWSNRCRHSFTTNTVAGQTHGAGKRRNTTINGFVSYNADTAHFDTHESDIGIQFNGCGAISGYPGTVTTDVKGFNTRCPTSFDGCWAEGYMAQGMTLFNNSDTAGDDVQPGADRTTVKNCRFNNPVLAGGVARGIRIENNRRSVLISNCQFYNIPNAPIQIESPASQIGIYDNLFHSCGSALSSSAGLIHVVGDIDDLIVEGNLFGAGTPAASARPLYIGTSVDGLIFMGNNCRGLTNKAPNIPAISTDVLIEKNLGLNPYGKITNPTNTTNNTIGLYGGTTTVPTSGNTYTIVGSDVLVSVTGGTVSDIKIEDAVGNDLIAGLTELKAQYIPRGMKLTVTHSVAPTVVVFAP